MTKEEILDFYDHNWNDHNIVFNMLSKALDEYQDEIDSLKNQLKNQNSNSTNNSDNSKEVKELKAMLLECQDKLDEETHSMRNT